MFCYLNKAEKDVWLPKLFAILQENTPCSPSLTQWLENVSPALDKVPRQILLMFAQGELAGFCQFYTREKMLMIEELQIKKAHQRTLLFCQFLKHLRSLLPQELETLEAYAHQDNHPSICLMNRLGLKSQPEPPFLHFSGAIPKFQKA